MVFVEKTTKPEAVVVWCRQTFRLADNELLWQAEKLAKAKGLPVVVVYIYSPESMGEWAWGGASKWWLHHSLISFKKSLQQLGNDLLILENACPAKALAQLAQHLNPVALFYDNRLEPTAVAEEKRVAQALKGIVELKGLWTSLLVRPETVLNDQGQPYKVFTPFWKKTLLTLKPELPLPAPNSLPALSLESFKALNGLPLDSLALLPKIKWDVGFYTAWPEVGEQAALARLESFLEGHAFNYKAERDFPAKPGTSRLSPALHWGELSPRQIWHSVYERFESQSGPASPMDFLPEGPRHFISEVGWREFAHNLLHFYPHTPTKPLNERFNQFPWEENPVQLKAWQQGLTGYPIIDAGMRELWATGLMHNRVRMIVGSFLVKDLRISWLEGAKWFWGTLVDADLASNTLGWQWVGGCGADAAPYFRVFNPVLQSQKFDPDGLYIRRWVPELSQLPTAALHEPWNATPSLFNRASDAQTGALGQPYPHPLVNHAEAKALALKAFEAVKA